MSGTLAAGIVLGVRVKLCSLTGDGVQSLCVGGGPMQKYGVFPSFVGTSVMSRIVVWWTSRDIRHRPMVGEGAKGKEGAESRRRGENTQGRKGERVRRGGRGAGRKNRQPGRKSRTRVLTTESSSSEEEESEKSSSSGASGEGVSSTSSEG